MERIEILEEIMWMYILDELKIGCVEDFEYFIERGDLILIDREEKKVLLNLNNKDELIEMEMRYRREEVSFIRCDCNN